MAPIESSVYTEYTLNQTEDHKNNFKYLLTQIYCSPLYFDTAVNVIRVITKIE